MSELFPRTVERIVLGRATSDGAGVKLTRVLTSDLQRRLDPFLMLDSFRNDNPDDYMGGFPDHPHRGFETVTYMIAGRMRHHDSAGNSGLLGPGGAQWMTAGSGLIHSELPEQEEGLMEGFQLWLNLPSQLKMCPPEYKDIPKENIPEIVTPEGALVRVIAGHAAGIAGAVQRPFTEPTYFDVHLPEGADFKHVVPSTHNAFLYVYRGEVNVGEQSVQDRQMAILKNEGSEIHVTAKVGSRFILIAGKPLNEQITQHGPFVMNTPEQIQQTFEDYQNGMFKVAKVQKL